MQWTYDYEHQHKEAADFVSRLIASRVQGPDQKKGVIQI